MLAQQICCPRTKFGLICLVNPDLCVCFIRLLACAIDMLVLKCMQGTCYSVCLATCGCMDGRRCMGSNLKEHVQAGYRLHDRVLRPAEVGVVQAHTVSTNAES